MRSKWFKRKALDFCLPAMMLAGVMVCPPASANFGEDPVKWLNQMADAMNSVSYQGTFVYIHDDQAETMQVFHRVADGVTRERLVSLNGTAREVIRDEETVRCYLPDDKAVFVEQRHDGSALARGIPLNAGEVGAFYEFQFIGSGRIAGRTARMIAVRPKDNFRYGYRIWLDEETALPLRSELVNSSDQPIEKMMFTEIRIGADISDEQLETSIDAESFEWHQRDKKRHDDDNETVPVSFTSLPPGFRISRSEPRDDGGYHVVVTDGLASVSVFAEPHEEGEPALAGLSRLGAVSAFGVRLQDHHVTVVGEVPEAAVTAIGEAVQLD